MFEIGVDYSYNDGYYFDTQNTSKQPSYSLLNGRISYLFEPLNVRLSVFGHNLTDEVYRSEEHTSELQSLMRISYAVFCLKKKKNTSISIDNNFSATMIESQI